MQRERVLQLSPDVQVQRVELLAHQQAAGVVVRGERATRKLVVLQRGCHLAGAQQRQAYVEMRIAAQCGRGAVAQGVERGLAQLTGSAAVDVEVPIGLREQARGVGGVPTRQVGGGLERGGQWSTRMAAAPRIGALHPRDRRSAADLEVSPTGASGRTVGKCAFRTISMTIVLEAFLYSGACSVSLGAACAASTTSRVRCDAKVWMKS